MIGRLFATVGELTADATAMLHAFKVSSRRRSVLQLRKQQAASSILQSHAQPTTSQPLSTPSAASSTAAASPSSASGRILLTFHTAEGIEQQTSSVLDESLPARKQLTLLDVAQHNDISELEGLCEGCCMCSTCHVYFDRATYDALGGDAAKTDEEQDMLDLAPHVEPTSRLGCQVKLSRKLQNANVYIPETHVNVANMIGND